MFHVIPISSELTISATPIGAKSIRHLFFESKNDSLFRFKTSPDTISISVDGKQICRDLLVLPFCTSSPCCPDRFVWQKVALEVNVNCNLSEVRILAQGVGDYNVIMVCSNEGVDESLGFDFFETKRVTLRKTANISVIRKALQEAFDKAAVTIGNDTFAELTSADVPRLWERFLKSLQGVEWQYTLSGQDAVLVRTRQYMRDRNRATSPQEPCAIVAKFAKLFSLSCRTLFVQNGFPVMFISGTSKASADNVKYLGDDVTIADSVSFTVRIDDADYTTADYCADKGIEETEVRKEDLFKMAQWVQQRALYNSEFFKGENVFRFDHEPRMMFVYNLARVHSPLSENDDVWLHCDYPLTFTLSGAGRELTEPDTDLTLYTANDRIAMRDALMTFNDEDGVTRSISVNVNRRKDARDADIGITRHPIMFADWTLFFLFGYKKIV